MKQMPIVNDPITDVAARLKQRFPPHLKRIVLFGSHARGQASRESDYDLLLVFDEVTKTVKAELDRFAGDSLLHEGLVLSCIPISEAELERHQFDPFLINAQKEGILL